MRTIFMRTIFMSTIFIDLRQKIRLLGRNIKQVSFFLEAVKLLEIKWL